MTESRIINFNLFISVLIITLTEDESYARI
jgi:hypothetical protein